MGRGAGRVQHVNKQNTEKKREFFFFFN